MFFKEAEHFQNSWWPLGFCSSSLVSLPFRRFFLPSQRGLLSWGWGPQFPCVCVWAALTLSPTGLCCWDCSTLACVALIHPFKPPHSVRLLSPLFFCWWVFTCMWEKLLQGIKLERKLLAVRDVPFWNYQVLPTLFLRVIAAVYVVTSIFYKYI